MSWCNEFASKRNEELHSGSSPYSLYTPEKWLADFYRISVLIQSFLGGDLSRIFGAETAAVAIALISDQAAHVKKQTVDSIKVSKAFLTGLTPEELRNREAHNVLMGPNSRHVECPTGTHKCVVSGEISHVSPPKLNGDNEIVVGRTIIPTRLACAVCGLMLGSHAARVEAGVGVPFTILQVEDPIDFHGIDIMEHVSDEDMQNYIANQYEPDYGND